MLLGVSRRIVQAEQRIEVFECFLRNLTAHFLRLVQNDDGSVRLDNINRTAGTELITLRVNNTGFLAFAVLLQRRSESLRIDNHYVNTGAGREVVKLVKVGTVIDEETSLLAVLFHKVVCGNLEGLIHALTDSDARNDNDKLAPSVTLVQLKHRLDVNVGLTRTGFHFNIKGTTTDFADELIGNLDIVLALNGTNILQKLCIGQLDSLVLVTGVAHHIDFIIVNGKLQLLIYLRLTKVSDIGNLVVVRLSVEYTNNSIHGFGLILLYLKVEFHSLVPPISFTATSRFSPARYPWCS